MTFLSPYLLQTASIHQRGREFALCSNGIPCVRVLIRGHRKHITTWGILTHSRPWMVRWWCNKKSRPAGTWYTSQCRELKLFALLELLLISQPCSGSGGGLRRKRIDLNLDVLHGLSVDPGWNGAGYFDILKPKLIHRGKSTYSGKLLSKETCLLTYFIIRHNSITDDNTF